MPWVLRKHFKEFLWIWINLNLFFQTFVFLIFWFQLYCGYSGQVMIDQMYLMLYNLLFTSLPPLAIGNKQKYSIFVLFTRVTYFQKCLKPLLLHSFQIFFFCTILMIKISYFFSHFRYISKNLLISIFCLSLLPKWLFLNFRCKVKYLGFRSWEN